MADEDDEDLIDGCAAVLRDEDATPDDELPVPE